MSGGVFVDKEEIDIHLDSFRGEFEQTFPPYSSKPILGKSSFVHAREGNDKIDQPSKTVLVRCIELKRLYQLNGQEILQSIQDRVPKVKGDFRQDEIIKLWKEKMDEHEKNTFSIGIFHIRCSSGTYVRSIAEQLGNKLKIGALAYSIVRTKVGDYDIKRSIR